LHVQISNIRQLDLKNRPGLQEIWHGSLYIPDFCFSELTTKDASPRKENDLNSAVRRTSEEEVHIFLLLNLCSIE